MLHPWLLDVLKDARGNGQTYVLLGVVIILVQLLELPGIWLKKPLVSERIRQRPNEKFIAHFGIGLAQLCHMFLSMMVFLHVMPFFGIDGMCFDYETRFFPCMMTTLGFIAILAKEALVFYLTLDMQKPGTSLELDSIRVKTQEIIGEIPLLLFAMVTFTMSWSAIMTFLTPVQAGEFWISLLSSVILFMMLYPSSRLVFIIETWLVKQPLTIRISNLFFFGTTLLAALWEVPGLF